MQRTVVHSGARTLLGVACVGAIAASAGDLLMLYVGNAQRPELHLAAPAPALLWIGVVLGVVGIPLYGLGYVGLRERFARRAAIGANVLASAGIAACVTGAAVHALTALAIDASLGTNAPSQAPLDAVAGTRGALGTSWLVCGIAFVAASVAFAYLQARYAAGRARWLAVANPLLITVALVALSVPFEWGRSFVAPAGPNLSHVAFFLLWSARLAVVTEVE